MEGGVSRFIVAVSIYFPAILSLTAQDISHPSVHQEQSGYFSSFSDQDPAFFDSIQGFRTVSSRQTNDCNLQRIVFGYHPYWMGSSYLNYQWNLLSDLCYFSYEVDPSTGDAVTTHEWLTDPVIDSAISNGVRVHLCVTLFSDHSLFFHNIMARQNLINNLIQQVQLRNAHGINIDFEALPSTLSDSLSSFIKDLASLVKITMPDVIISIALPAVNWNNLFDIHALDQHIDLFMIMGYDYYWNGSLEAGPVSPLYSLTSSYDYSLARTIAAYQSEGLSEEKFVLGIPYYGRQWKTKSNTIPSQCLATGMALTYANIRNNGGGNYKPGNYIWESNSFSSCYVFFQNDSWNQCFIGLDRDVRKWYDQVNYHQLAGIGIWALGYDNGYLELWQAISDKFSDCYIPVSYDTLFDSGGPSWDHYTGENYLMTIDHGFNDTRWLTFTNFNLEDGHDSLWLFAGPDTLSPLIGSCSGTVLPGTFTSPSGSFTLRFKSDFLNNRSGWSAVFHDGSFGTGDLGPDDRIAVEVYPNPVYGDEIFLKGEIHKISKITISDFTGRVIAEETIRFGEIPPGSLSLMINRLPAAIYIITVFDNKGNSACLKFLKVE